MKYKKIALCIFHLLLICTIRANNDNFGGKIGLSFQFGTHIQRIGLMYQIYYFNNISQIGHGTSLHFNRKALGAKGAGLELQSQASIQLFWGESAEYKKHLLNEFSLLAEEQYAAGLLYKFYYDKVESSQATGSIFCQINRVGFVMENDFLSFTNGHEDKFRTGSIAFSYTHDSLLFAIQSTLWTGKGLDGQHINNSEYPSKYGYKDLSKAKHGKLSHGILAFRMDYLYKYNQALRFESGIDAEQIRHALQNKLMHDFLIPSNKNMNGNPHYPMLQENGSPYLFENNQKIREPRLYLQIGTNPFMFY